MLGRHRASAWWLLAVAGLVGCGGDSGRDDNRSGVSNDAGEGGSSSGGAGQSGGAGPTGGKGEAASAGTGGGSGAPSSAQHCSPGQTYENFRAFADAGGPISNCYGYDPTDVGQPADAEISVRSIALADPLAAGSEMAFSIEWIAGGASIEYWGTNDHCGAGAERLSPATSMCRLASRHLSADGRESEAGAEIER